MNREIPNVHARRLDGGGQGARAIPIDHASLVNALMRPSKRICEGSEYAEERLDMARSIDETKRREVQEQQRPIAEWMRTIMAQKGWNPTNWAKAAGLGRDTVSRAIKEDYAHVTSTVTLLKLARTAKVPAPLHLVPTSADVPSAELLGTIIGEMLKWLVPDREWDAALLAALGQALRQTLAEIAEDPAQKMDADSARMAARIFARQQLPLDNTEQDPEND